MKKNILFSLNFFYFLPKETIEGNPANLVPENGNGGGNVHFF
jgi:hypothetical protein